jgi:hypothetical protein
MVKTKAILKNEDGAVIIFIAILILALLSIISIAASNTANIEVLIAGNEYGYKQNFYLAEGAALEAVDKMEAISDPYDTPPVWLEKIMRALKDDNLNDYWVKLEDPDATNAVPEASSADQGNTHFMAGAEGIIGGASLGMDSPSVHGYAIYGRCENNGVVSIKVGYRKAF